MPAVRSRVLGIRYMGHGGRLSPTRLSALSPCSFTRHNDLSTSTDASTDPSHGYTHFHPRDKNKQLFPSLPCRLVDRPGELRPAGPATQSVPLFSVARWVRTQLGQPLPPPQPQHLLPATVQVSVSLCRLPALAFLLPLACRKL